MTVILASRHGRVHHGGPNRKFKLQTTALWTIEAHNPLRHVQVTLKLFKSKCKNVSLNSFENKIILFVLQE